MLDDKYWDHRYQQENTPWDLGIVSPPLKAYFDQIKDTSLSILIPGFGRGYELIYLESLGFTNLTGIEYSQTTIDALSSKLNNTTLIQGDFFNLTGKFDLIIEQTFFCALEPSQRIDYIKKMKSLLKSNGKLVGVLFNREFQGGPPFGGDIDEYRALFKEDFQIEILEPCKNSYHGRIEVFIKCTKQSD